MTTLATADDSGSPVIVVSGLSGVGTSSLVVQWGHQDGEELYPDGTLYADLRQERAQGGTAIAAVLGQFLDSCGCEVPKDLASRQARFRSYLHGKRVLVILDHVEHEAEIESLRPSSVGSALIATCRYRGDFVAGQQDLPMRPLEYRSARQLVIELIGEKRVIEAESEIAKLIELCEGVPKLLCLAVGRMKRNPNVTAADVLAWLREELTRDDRPDHASVLDIVVGDAYEALSGEAARVYRFMGCHPGRDVAREALDMLADRVGGRRLDVLEELCDHHLLDPRGEGRFGLPELVRAHARAKARGYGVDREEQALKVWASWYVTGAQAADRAFIPDRNRVFGSQQNASKSFSDDQAAMAWLDAERHNLLALQRLLYERGRHRQVMELGESMWVLYIGALYLEDWLESSRLSVKAAVADNNVAAEVRFRAFLGRALMENAPNAADPERMWDEAETELDRARRLPVSDGAGRDMRASATEFKGRLFSYQGRYSEAIAQYTLAMKLFTERAESRDAPEHERRANRRGIALQHQFIGVCRLMNGDYAAAVESLRQAEARLIESSHYRDVAKIRTYIGEALRHMNDLHGAHEVLTEAVNALRGKRWFRVETEALWQLSLVANARSLTELEHACLNRLREQYSVTRHPRLTEVDERLDRLTVD